MLTLKSSTDFQRVRRTGRSWTHPLVVLITCPNSQSETRVGVAAGKSVGGAVARNKAKRRLREALRQAHKEKSVPPGWDLVWIARTPLVQAAWPEVKTAVTRLLKKAGVITDTE